MPLRQVDVMDKQGALLCTYPITLGKETLPKASDFERAALTEATKAKLVPDSEIAHLKARMQRHVVAHSDLKLPTAARPAVPAKV